MRMHETLALAQELEWSEVVRYHAEQRAQLARLEGSRRGGDGEGDGNRVGVEVDSLQVSIRKPCEEAADNARITDEALQWSLGWNDVSMLGYLRQELPLAIQQEQLRKYEHSKSCTTVAEAKKPLEKFVIFPDKLKSRDHMVKRFLTYLGQCGWRSGRIPRGAAAAFASSITWSHKVPIKDKIRFLCRAFHRHRKAPLNAIVRHNAKRVSIMQGAPLKSPWLYEHLYEWWVSMRYAIDWNQGADSVQAVYKSLPRHKCLARFTRSILMAKAKQICMWYVREMMLRDHVPKCVRPSHMWISRWAKAYGLKWKRPNRKYKVPKQVQMIRCEIGWLNVVRIRTLAVETLGYDLSMENWDQTPFHHNEGGSKNVPTLAAIGQCIVPVIEGHSDTKERWTLNTATFSDKQRIMDGDLPGAQFNFKADGEKLEAELQAHCRDRGYAPKFSAITSEKGSYREAHVLTFIDMHIPKIENGRKWRLAIADDHGPHLSPKVERIMWSHGYAYQTLGGGVTPVQQTVDTDLNQSLKRHYVDVESLELMWQMLDGKTVPIIRQKKAIDIMVKVLKSRARHLEAADGYVKTGWLCSLDNAEGDNLICREAGVFWKELGMREKVNAAVAEVREEIKHGRLSWCLEDVKRLKKPFPEVREVDAVLKAIGEDAGDDGCWENRISNYDDSEDDDDPFGDRDLECRKWKQSSKRADAIPAISNLAGNGGKVAGKSLVAIEDGSGAASATALSSQQRLATLHSAASVMKKAGQCRIHTVIENEANRLVRMQNAMSKQDNDVMYALARQRDADQEKAEKQRQMFADVNDTLNKRRKLEAEVETAKRNLKAIEDKHRAQKELNDCRNAMQTVLLRDIEGGIGNRQNRVKAAVNVRAQVLDKLSKHGSGLTAWQRNDFPWFKTHWEQKMSALHGDDWPNVFTSWMQNVIELFEEGTDNAFSEFVRSETERNFAGEPALTLPGTAAASSDINAATVADLKGS